LSILFNRKRVPHFFLDGNIFFMMFFINAIYKSVELW